MFLRKFHRLKHTSGWRRIAVANWRAPNDPTVYGSLPMDFTQAQIFLDQINRASDVKISATHLVAKATALMLAKFPDLNGIVRWNSIYLRKTVDIFLQVAIGKDSPDEKLDLSGAKIENCDQKSLLEIARELKEKANLIRSQRDPHIQKTVNLFNKIPQWLLSWVVRLGSFLVYNFDLHLPQLGLMADSFGSAMVTSVGMLKMPAAFAPLVPASRVPLIICVGQVTDQPVVVDGQVVVRPMLDLTVTFDHRFIDGLMGSRMVHYFRQLFEDPSKFLS